MMAITLINKQKISSFFFSVVFLSVFLLPAISFAQVLTSTDTVTISAIVGGTTSGGGGGGGGGGSSAGDGGSGGGFNTPPIETLSTPTSVTFAGLAYPSAHVFLLNNSVALSDVIAFPNGHFSISVPSITDGMHVFSIVAEDGEGVRSLLINLPINLAPNTTTTINNLFIPPTISSSSDEYTKGDIVNIHGQSVPNASISLVIDFSLSQTLLTDTDGLYSADIDTSSLSLDDHTIGVKAEMSPADGGQKSGSSKIVSFLLKSFLEKILPEKIVPTINADLNNDKIINIEDFSIMAFWYRKPNPPKMVDLNGDGKISLADFSILAYKWNG